MLYLVFTILIVGFLAPGDIEAQERGVGVTPSEITIEQDVEWPYVVSFLVTNFSEDTEQFEVTFEKEVNTNLSAAPGRFELGSGERKQVLVTFDPPVGGSGPAGGFIKVVSKRTSLQGFTTGTGMKIPFTIAKQSDVKFVAGAAGASSWGSMSQVFAGLIMLLAIGFLWYLAYDARRPNQI